MDGWITIGTKLENRKFDKDVEDLQRKIRNEEEKLQVKIDAKVEKENALEQQQKETDKLAKKYEKLLYYKKEYLKASRIVDTADFPSPEWVEANRKFQDYGRILGGKAGEFSNIEKLEKQLDAAVKKEEKLNAEIQRTENSYKKVEENVARYKSQLERVNLAKAEKQINNIKTSANKAGITFSKILKTVARWSLALMSIRSIYNLLSVASSTLSQYNEQYASNLEYIRYALAQMVAPVLEYIVKLMLTILQYINYIAKAWFGVNLFANASAEAFKKAKDGTTGMAKNAEKIRKELQQANFDEMNVLQDNQSANSAGAGGGGAVAPSIDLSNIEDIKIPGWLEWIKDHKDEILTFLTALGVLIAGIKIYELVKGVGQLLGGISSIKALGITMIILGVALAIKSLIDYLNDPTWKNFGKIIQGIGIAIIGLGLTVGSVTLGIIGLAILVHGTIIKYWDKIKAKLDEGIGWFDRKAEELQKFLDEKLNWLPQKFGSVGTLIKASIQLFVKATTTVFSELFKTVVGIFDNIYKGLKKVLDGIIMIFKGDFKGGIKEVAEGIGMIFKGLVEGIELKFVVAFRTIKTLFSEGGQIFDGLKEGLVGTLKGLLNVLISKVNLFVSEPIVKINRLLNRVKSIRIDLGALGSFSPFSNLYSDNPIPVPRIPMLAKGTILNNPRKRNISRRWKCYCWRSW